MESRPTRSLIDPREIEDAMLSHLRTYVATHYGTNVQPAVRLQASAAAVRLRRVARVQAARIADGWEIHEAEASVNEDVANLNVDGQPQGLRGRFDRIDRHRQTGRWAILDYKTHGHRPEKKHLEKGPAGEPRFVDLQLPLYRRMIPFLGIDADPAGRGGGVLQHWGHRRGDRDQFA